MNTKPTIPAALKAAILALAALHADLQAAVTAGNITGHPNSVDVLLQSYAGYQKMQSATITADAILDIEPAPAGGVLLGALKDFAGKAASAVPTDLAPYQFYVQSLAGRLGLLQGIQASSIDASSGWVRDTLTRLAAANVLNADNVQSILDMALVADPASQTEIEAALNA